MIPSVGRIVHYTNLGDRDGKYPPEVQAAIITKVKRLAFLCRVAACECEARWDEADGPVCDGHATPGAYRLFAKEEHYKISLRVFYEMGDFILQDVPFTEADAGSEEARGKWTWPARV